MSLLLSSRRTLLTPQRSMVSMVTLTGVQQVPLTVGASAITRVQSLVSTGGLSLVSATTGSVVFRIRPTHASTVYTGGPTLLFWMSDVANYIRLRYTSASTAWEVQRRNTAAQTIRLQGHTFDAGTDITVAAAWNGTDIFAAIDGQAFVSAANTHIPDAVGASADLFNQNNSLRFDCTPYWVSFHDAVLTNAEFAAIHERGNTPPDPLTIPHCTGVWPARGERVWRGRQGA